MQRGAQGRSHRLDRASLLFPPIGTNRTSATIDYCLIKLTKLSEVWIDLIRAQRKREREKGLYIESTFKKEKYKTEDSLGPSRNFVASRKEKRVRKRVRKRGTFLETFPVIQTSNIT